MRMRYVYLTPLCNLACSLLHAYEGVIMPAGITRSHLTALFPVVASQNLVFVLYVFTSLVSSLWLLQQLTAHECRAMVCPFRCALKRKHMH